MAGRLNPKQIRAKKVADSQRKAMKTGGKKKDETRVTFSTNIPGLAEHLERAGFEQEKPAPDAKVTAAFNRATNP